MKNQSKRWAVIHGVAGLSGLAVSAMFAQNAGAALMINLVFPDGSHTMTVSPTDQYKEIPVLVYGTMTGLNPVTTTPGANSGNFDGIQYAYYNIVSSAGSYGALEGNVDSGRVNPAYGPALDGYYNGGNNPTGFAVYGSQAGAVQDLNGDGIADLGATADNLLQMAKPRSATAIWSNSTFAGSDPTGAQQITIGGTNNNTVSFLLETIYFQVPLAISKNQSTILTPQTPNLGNYAPTNYFLDVPSLQPGAGVGPQYTYSDVQAGTSVTFTAIPEPTCAAIACTLPLGLLARRRRRV